ncbi:MAG: DUF2087 domain-containing protein [Paracoccaceae bacterium]
MRPRPVARAGRGGTPRPSRPAQPDRAGCGFPQPSASARAGLGPAPCHHPATRARLAPPARRAAPFRRGGTPDPLACQDLGPASGRHRALVPAAEGESFTERQISARLDAHHSFGDAAILRRTMIELKLLSRTPDGRDYRR